MLERRTIDRSRFNAEAELPYELRVDDFASAMQDVYDFLYDVNSHLVGKGLQRLDDTLRKAIMSGLLSDMLTASIAKHSRALTENQYHNGHPDLLVRGIYPMDSVRSGTDGVEIKTTMKGGGAVDTHGARPQWMCVFVDEVDRETEPAIMRDSLIFREVYLAKVELEDFRRNARGELGTRTATLDRNGIAKLRRGWIYLARRSSLTTQG